MNPFDTTQDPAWHRWVDGLVILVIGIALGVVMSQLFVSYETEVTTTKVIRTLPNGANETPEDAGEATTPDSSVRILEI